MPNGYFFILDESLIQHFVSPALILLSRLHFDWFDRFDSQTPHHQNLSHVFKIPLPFFYNHFGILNLCARYYCDASIHNGH